MIPGGVTAAMVLSHLSEKSVRAVGHSACAELTERAARTSIEDQEIRQHAQRHPLAGIVAQAEHRCDGTVWRDTAVGPRCGCFCGF